MTVFSGRLLLKVQRHIYIPESCRVVLAVNIRDMRKLQEACIVEYRRK